MTITGVDTKNSATFRKFKLFYLPIQNFLSKMTWIQLLLKEIFVFFSNNIHTKWLSSWSTIFKVLISTTWILLKCTIMTTPLLNSYPVFQLLTQIHFEYSDFCLGHAPFLYLALDLECHDHLMNLSLMMECLDPCVTLATCEL